MWNPIMYLRKREKENQQPLKNHFVTFPWSVTIGSNNFIKFLRNSEQASYSPP